MNILFITNKNVDPVIGGIERITYVLADAFQRLHGHRCFSAFTQRLNDVDTPFEAELLLIPGKEASMLTEFIKGNDISIVIAQGSDAAVNALVHPIRTAVSVNSGCRMIFVFHNKPGFEHTRMSTDVLFYRIMHGHDVAYNIKYLLFQTLQPLLRPLLRHQLQKKYLPAYQVSDRLVVLTDGFIDDYARCAGLPAQKHSDVSARDAKFCAIGNAASFGESFDMQSYDGNKAREVLWVGRFDDKHKRLSETLHIWATIEQSNHYSDWTLRIVGYGPDEDYYHYLVKRLGLQHVSFEGKTESLPYYRRASIFMMTSAFEGFPLVITEAQQMGVVPVVFDTFAALHDIVSDGINGYIIPEGNRQLFAQRVMHLMDDASNRKIMAENAIKMIERFSVENVTSQWNQLFDKL